MSTPQFLALVRVSDFPQGIFKFTTSSANSFELTIPVKKGMATVFFII
jgi:hypothetical protein